MWLSNSSVGRKVVMSVTGIALSRLVHHSHHLCLLADYAEPPCTR